MTVVSYRPALHPRYFPLTALAGIGMGVEVVVVVAGVDGAVAVIQQNKL
jgi:hypothetical protein